MLYEQGGCVKIRFFVPILFCLLFSSCTKHQSSQQKNDTEQPLVDSRNDILDTIIQQEAMLVDVPIPLYDERIIPSSDQISNTDTLAFGYKSPLSRTQVIEFFMNQMERYGWKHLVSFGASEILLQFESPDRYCSVVIKNSDHTSSHSSIFIYIKKSEHIGSLISSGLG